MVALNYPDIVMDDERDVVLEFCTEQCDHYRMLLPTLEKVSWLYASNTNHESQVTIGTINVDANEIPDREIPGFPTLKLYPASSKDAPVSFSKARTLRNMADFIRNHGKQRAETPGIEEEEDETATSGPNERSEQAGVSKGVSIAQGEPKPSGHDEL